jgi:hypothetical protein
MFNNVNKPGFSLGDYISFSGGLSSLSDGGGHIALGGENSFPVNFGQPVYGTGSNGAAGLNFSISKSQDNRFFMSYLGNGSKRQISETSRTLNFSPGNSFRLDESKEEIVTDTTHRFNIGLRKMIGSNQNIIMNGAFSWNESSNPVSSVSGSFLNDVQVNSLQRTTSELPDRLSGTADASYLLRINEGRSIFKISGKVDLAGNSTCSEFLNRTEFLNPYREEITNQFYDVRSAGSNYSGTAAFTRRLSGRSSAEISLTAGYSVESIIRKQGNVEGGKIPDPELSPDFRKTDRSIRPGITWKLATRKSQLSLSGFATLGRYSTMLNGDGATGQDYFYLTPRAHWEYEYRSGRRLMFSYTSSVNTPSASRLLPVVNNINPLSLLYGNLNLKPEYIHNARLTWWLFDQYSFTTLLTGLSFNYTRDKIGYMRDIDENLAQVIRFINVSNDWDGSANLDFSTPVKPFGLKVDLSVSETVSRGLTVVNQAENIFRSFAHRISLTLENRKKNKWDIQTGSAFTLTDSRYSVARSMNNVYRDLSWFSEVRFTPGVHLNFMASADITNYTAKSFNESQVVPLVGAEVNFCFLRNQRGVLTLKGVDLLNRNSGIERNGELNYLTERRSSMIGRYIMLAFSYRLNKLGDNKGGVDVRIRNH